MARIRTIKPEFWTSEQIAECSPNARLLFIGLWNFCDDYGVHPAKVMTLKMQVFPADAFTKAQMQAMVDELESAGLIETYTVDNEAYWFVTGWDKHQKPDTKTGKWPRPDGRVGAKIRRMNTEYSPNERRTFADHSPPEKEKEKEKDINISPPLRARAREEDVFNEKKLLHTLEQDQGVFSALAAEGIPDEFIRAAAAAFRAQCAGAKKRHKDESDLLSHFMNYARKAHQNQLKNEKRNSTGGRRANGRKASASPDVKAAVFAKFTTRSSVSDRHREERD